MQHTIDTMLGRDKELGRAIDFVTAGTSVDVVGGRGSGRTTLLDALRARLEESGWNVISIPGIASLRSRPLGVLQLGGRLGGADGRTLHAVPAAADALRNLARTSRSVLMLDDWDDLDEVTWGVVEMVRRSTRLPVVLTRLAGRRARHTPTGLDGSSLETAYVIELTALPFHEFERLVEARLHGAVEAGTMSRLYAKSGASIGLALNLVDAGVHEGRLQLVEGVWTATGELWSSSLRGIVEGYLENLDDDSRDALEVIALVGVVDVDTVRKLVDWSTLERLEERGLIRILPNGRRQVVTVTPPLLVEFFRHDLRAARRMRLAEFIESRIGSANEILSTIGESRTTNHAEEALLARLAHEHTRTRRLLARAQWEADRTPATAVAYVDALMRSGSPSGLVDDVFQNDFSTGPELDRAVYAVARANWTAFVKGAPADALASLQSAAQGLGVYAPVAAAAEVSIITRTQGVPPDYASRLEVLPEHPVEVKVALWETRQLVQLSLGLFADARLVYEQIEACRGVTPSPQASALFAMTMLGEGDFDSALEWALNGVDEANGALDVDAASAHGAVAALCFALAGDYQPAEKLLETLLVAGTPSAFPPGIPMLLGNVASVIVTRCGDTATGERLAREARERGPFGPLPGQSSAWPEAQILSSAGRTEEAADLVWNASLELWARGAKFSAVLGLLASVEIRHDDERLRVAASGAEELGGGLLTAHAAFLEARHTQDPALILASVDALIGCGRHGLALAALRLAASGFAAKGDTGRASEARTRAEEYTDSLGARRLDTARFATASVTLTGRELEVARLVALGHSNPEIATRLVLSVRTVENHVHRIMRKLDLVNRQELKHWIDRGVAS